MDCVAISALVRRQEVPHDRCLIGAAARHGQPHQPGGDAPPAGYTHVVEVTAGRPVYIAGQVVLDPDGALVGPGNIGAQAGQVFDNLQAALQAVGAGFEQVVKLAYYRLCPR
jgi:enamine deaminase RidA (YjgF/YER057c/UK114 family)